MVKIIFVCLILALGLACDDGGPGGTCVDLAEDTSFVFDFDPECPTVALKQVCNRYSCIQEGTNFNGTVRPRACKRQDCFVMTCDRVVQDGDTFR
jgi:hypothetical protein